MADKTFQGKSCPKCSSFIQEGVRTCSVCGFSWDSQGAETLAEPGQTVRSSQNEGVTCSKCGTENAADFKFCKICKHPLIEDREQRTDIIASKSPRVGEGPVGKVSLIFEWAAGSSNPEPNKTFALRPLAPYFLGILEWGRYGFFVYKKGMDEKIMVRRIASADGPVLFKKKSYPFVCESGKDFYLGSIRFRVMGDLNERHHVKTVIKSNETVFRGPGERDEQTFSSGLPRLQILEFKIKQDVVELEQRTMIGRDYLVNEIGANEDELRGRGISSEHLAVTPLDSGRWLLEPVPEKPVFIEIDEGPEIFHPGDWLRWTSGDEFAEFQIMLTPSGG